MPKVLNDCLFQATDCGRKYTYRPARSALRAGLLPAGWDRPGTFGGNLSRKRRARMLRRTRHVAGHSGLVPGKNCSPKSERRARKTANPAFTLPAAWCPGQSRNRCLPWFPSVPWSPAHPPGNRSRVPGGPRRRHGWVSYPPLSAFPSTRFSSATASPQ